MSSSTKQKKFDDFIFINKDKKFKFFKLAVEGFKDTGVIHDTDIHYDGRHTAHNSQEYKRTDMSELHDIEKKSSTDVKSLVAEDEKMKERKLLKLIAIKGFKDTGVIHDPDIHYDGRHTAHNSQEDKGTEMSELHDIEKKSSKDAKPLVAEDEKMKERNQAVDVQRDLLDANVHLSEATDNRVTEDKYKDQEMGCIQQATSETQAQKVLMSEEKPATIDVYSNMVRNEKSRMMSSIDRIVAEATHLFGPENTQIFFDLLAENMPHFESAGTNNEFEPNMADSVIRQHVISFFEHAKYVMAQIMTSLSSAPDSERLQQMPEPDFRALIKHVIESSLESNSDLTKRLCLEGDKLTRDDLHHFIATLEGNTPEDILNRLRLGHEMFAYGFADKNEISQPTEKREEKLILTVFFPSDCRFYIGIPTEKGSYWHQLDMQRANK